MRAGVMRIMVREGRKGDSVGPVEVQFRRLYFEWHVQLQYGAICMPNRLRKMPVLDRSLGVSAATATWLHFELREC